MNLQLFILFHLLLSGVFGDKTALIGIIKRLATTADEISASADLTVNILLNNQNATNDLSSELGQNYQASSTYTNDIEFWSKLRHLREHFKSAINVFNIPNGNSKRHLKRYMWNIKSRLIATSRDRRMDLICHNFFFIFTFDNPKTFSNVKSILQSLLKESINILATVEDEDKVLIYWNKADPMGENQLRKVNEWKKKQKRFLHFQLFPPISKVYSNLMGRKFYNPVLHKPPWNYLTYDKSGPDKKMLEDNGGRDITLLELLGQQLNFTHESIDPKLHNIHRVRGSAWKGSNLAFPGIIGKIHRREDPFHMYLGDIAQTFPRNSACEFTFYVLADSGAFITMSPSRVNPSSIILKPFQTTVWILLIASAFVIIFAIVCMVQHAKAFQGSFNTDVGRLEAVFEDTLLQTISRVNQSLIRATLGEGDEQVFLVKSTSLPFLRSATLAIGIWMLLCTMVLVPSYRGTLLSFFYTPFKEKPMDTLAQLNKAMEGNFTLGLVNQSSSHGIVTTGGGIYDEIWAKMQRTQWLIPQVRKGLERVANDPKFAVMANREKLTFERLHLGFEKFHINSEIFFIKFKTIALRNGSPLRTPFDKLLLKLFNAGIINKITLDEYNCVTPRKGKYAWKHKCPRITYQAEDDKIALTYVQFETTLGLCLVMLALSALVFIIEITYAYWRTTKTRRQRKILIKKTIKRRMNYGKDLPNLPYFM